MYGFRFGVVDAKSGCDPIIPVWGLGFQGVMYSQSCRCLSITHKATLLCGLIAV